MTTKRTTSTPKDAPAGNRFTAPAYLTHVAHGQAVYPVVDGVVTLPAGETWYRSLVESGELMPVEQ